MSAPAVGALQFLEALGCKVIDVHGLNVAWAYVEDLHVGLLAGDLSPTERLSALDDLLAAVGRALSRHQA